MSTIEEPSETTFLVEKKKRRPQLKKVGMTILILGTVLSIGIGLGAYGRALNIQDELHLGIAYTPREENNLFAPPPDMENFIWDVSNSLVQITCYDGNYKYSGTGFAIDLSWAIELDQGYKTHIVSNNHVVDECLANDGEISMSLGPEYKEEIQVDLINLDAENDLALYQIKEEMPFLTTATYFSSPGEWNMVIGNPASIMTDETLDNATTFGNTIAVEEEKYNFTSAVINLGNSGGPLVNSRGQLIGITTYAWASTKDGVHNIAMDSELLCEKIIECE